MGEKSVLSVSFDVVSLSDACLTTLVCGIETVRVTVLAFGFAIFLASTTTLVLVANINSSAAHLVASSARSNSLRMALRDCCISSSAVLSILIFSCSQCEVSSNHQAETISTSLRNTAARKIFL